MYDSFAREYHEATREGFYHKHLELPAMRKMFENVELKDKMVLDVGCGSGRHCEWLMKEGAKIVGLDPSRKLLEIAKRELKDVHFVRGKASKLPFGKNIFDYIISGLALDHERDLGNAFKEVFRVLKPGGFMVFSRLNPVTAVTKKSGDNLYFFEGYFKEGRRMIPFPTFGVEVPYYHFTNETIFRMIRESGLVLCDYVDAKPGRSSSYKFPDKYIQNWDRPYFSIYKLSKNN